MHSSVRAPTTVRKWNKTRANFSYFIISSLYRAFLAWDFILFFILVLILVWDWPISYRYEILEWFLKVWLLLLNTDFDDVFNNFGWCMRNGLFFDTNVQCRRKFYIGPESSTTKEISKFSNASRMPIVKFLKSISFYF